MATATTFIDVRGEDVSRSVATPTTRDWGRLRQMARYKSMAPWVGLFLGVLTQAIVFASWLGSMGTQVEVVKQELSDLRLKQETMAPGFYSLPSMKDSLLEIKGDLKELRSTLQSEVRNNKGGERR